MGRGAVKFSGGGSQPPPHRQPAVVGERCNLSQWGLGGTPADIVTGAFLYENMAPCDDGI